MRMEVHLQQRMEQRMHLSQQMLQNLELLQLPLMELRDLIVEELQENPTLEEKQDVEEGEPSTQADPPEETAEDIARREMMESVEEQWADSERRTRRTDSAENAERRMDMLNNLCSESTSLREHLLSQLVMLDVDEETRIICDHVIQNMEDDGYLRISVQDVAGSLESEILDDPHEIVIRKVEHALTIVQSMEPRGVGARSIKECLLLQLKDTDPWTPLVQNQRTGEETSVRSENAQDLNSCEGFPREDSRPSPGTIKSISKDNLISSEKAKNGPFVAPVVTAPNPHTSIRASSTQDRGRF